MVKQDIRTPVLLLLWSKDSWERGRMIDEKKLIEDLEKAKSNCEHLYELLFFDGVMAIVDTQQQINGWISVKERLPKEDIGTPTYVTIRHKETGYTFTARMRWFFGKFEWYNGKTLSDIYEIVAWKHEDLPEPWKEDAYAERN